MTSISFKTAFIISIFLLAALISGCESGAPSVPGKQANAAAGDSKYPPIPTAVAQSDLKNLDGSTFKVGDKKGGVLLLNMWATWCGPCRAEMPTLVKLQDEYRSQGLEVIGLNTDDESVEDINRFAQSMSLNYTLVWADTALQRELLKISQFPGIPQSFIIDRDGRLRGVFKGANPRDVKEMEVLVGKVIRGEDVAAPQLPASNAATTQKLPPVNFNSDSTEDVKGRPVEKKP